MALFVARILFLCLLPSVSIFGQTLFDSFRGDIRSCEMSCEDKFPGREGNAALLFSFCRRGCRLMNLVDILDDFNDLNDTKKACYKSCHDSYKDEKNVEACLLGCESQVPAASNRKQQMKDYQNKNFDNIAPSLYVKPIYSNMIEKGIERMSHSYFTQANNGGLVVVVEKSTDDAFDNADDDKLNNYMETEPPSSWIDRGTDERPENEKKEEEKRVARVNDDVDPTWHTCVIIRTGFSRVLVVCVIGMLIMFAVWILVGSPSVTRKSSKSFPVDDDLKYLLFSSDDLIISTIMPEKKKLSGNGINDRSTNLLTSPLPMHLKIESV